MAIIYATLIVKGKKTYAQVPEKIKPQVKQVLSKGQILRSTPNTAPLICGACNTQPEGLSTMA